MLQQHYAHATRLSARCVCCICTHALRRAKKPHLQGRFSGRLATKEDERRLTDECRLLGPLLGGVGKRGDGSRQTLAKIVRGIASGHVRAHCEGRERKVEVRNRRLLGRSCGGCWLLPLLLLQLLLPCSPLLCVGCPVQTALALVVNLLHAPSPPCSL